MQQTGAPSGIFLSGNGPLVRIVREAIVRSQAAKGRNKRDCEREATTFIQNVHNFLRFYWEERQEELPHEHVVVFDEAQRGWDRERMSSKRKIDASEATLLMDVMERFPDWAVIVALVGGGQEIFLGEAGLGEWGRALEKRHVPWRVVASPEVLAGGDSVAGHKLVDGAIPPHINFRRAGSAHLDLVVRSHRAQRWAEWVNEFLSCRFQRASRLFPNTDEFPCFVTRTLANAKSWLTMHYCVDPEERIGLIATSKDHRLRAYGIERAGPFLMNYPFEKWFLEEDTDVRSSYSLEVAASEFECQGLELDWIGLCWGGDLLPSPSATTWDYRRFRGANWQTVRQDAERAYTLNRYRVLLTRARKGLVVWVPQGDRKDPTRDPEGFNRVFDALVDAGVPQLEDHFTQGELTSSATMGLEDNPAIEGTYHMGQSKNE